MNQYDLIVPKMKPYEHQIKAVNEAIPNLEVQGFHALFMEMGTGKTKTAIDSFLIMYSKGLVDALIIVAPKAILSVWEKEEIGKHFVGGYIVDTWDGKDTKKSWEAFNCGLLSKDVPFVYIVNIEAFQSLPDAMHKRVTMVLKMRKAMLVIDEASYVKSYDAKRSKNLLRAATLAVAKMELTGTEVTNTPLDLYMLFEIMRPGFWGVKSFFMFRARYAILEDAYGPRGVFKKVVGFQRMQELLERILPYCSRALKKDCLDLPDKIHIRVLVDLSPKQAATYTQLKESLMAMVQGNVLTVPNKISLFTKFRQIPGGGINVDGEAVVIDEDPPKLKALLADIEDTSEQAIVWAAFTHEIKMLKTALSEIAKTVTFYGEDDQEVRDANKEAFTSGKARFLVANPQAGAYGLNLQNCHLQYFYSRTLSPSQNWQAEDRIHRSGQKEVCVYKVLVARGTVDERIEELLEAKTDVRTKFQDMTISDIVNLV